MTQPDGASTTVYAYAGNETTVTDPASKWKTLTSDAEGNLITVTEPDPVNQPAGTLTTTYSYDWMNHLSVSTMTRGGTTQTRAFVYDDQGHLASATNPESGTTTYSYNTDGTLWYKHDAKGIETVYAYDETKRVTTMKRFPTGRNNAEAVCERVTYSYDTNPYDEAFPQYSQKRLTAVQYSACVSAGTKPPLQITEMYSYNPAGGVTTRRTRLAYYWHDPEFNEDLPVTTTLDLSYTYNLAGQVAAIAVPTGWPARWWDTGFPAIYTYSTGFDGMGRPVSMQDDNLMNEHGVPLQRVRSATYDFAGRLTSFQTLHSAVQDPSGSGQYLNPSYEMQTQTYNTSGQLASIGWSGAGLNGTITYGYSATANNGQIQQAVDTVSGETTVYQYDSLKRLTSAQSTPIAGSSPAAWTETYGYDGFGNLTSKTLNGTVTPIAVTGATNRLTNAFYDLNGNMTSGAGATFVFDGANRIQTAMPVSGGAEKYAYAPDNKRVFTVKSNGQEEFVLYGLRGERLGVYWFDNEGFGMRKTYLYFSGRLVGEGQWPFGFPIPPVVYQDRLGTNRAGGARFRPYGDEIGTATAQDRVKFGTYTRDGFTGLDYADQRFYASSYGRFNTADPYQASGGPGDPGSWNRYAYVGGDPINKLDPSGLLGWDPGYYDSRSGGQYDSRSGRIAGQYGGDAMEMDRSGQGDQGGGSDQRGGGTSNATTFAAAQGAFERAAGTISHQKFKKPCNDDFTALGITASAVTTGAANAVFLNGIGSEVSRASLYASSPVDGVRQAGGSVTGTVGDYFGTHPGTVAMAQLGGSDIYLNSSLIDPTNYFQNIATTLHEILHNVTGLTDSDIQSRLRIPSSDISNNITQKLLKDCF